MAGLPNQFLKGGEGAVASYDWTDIAEGVGIVQFFGYEEQDSSGTTYRLSQNAVYSYNVEATQQSIPEGATYAKYYDYDYDLAAFNSPRTVKGTATCILPIMIGNSVAATSDVYVVFKFRKYDGSTETEISSITSNTVSHVGADETYQILNPSGSISEHDFQEDEILRVTVEVWARHTGSSDAGKVQIAYDPKDREGVNFTAANIDSRIFQVNVPFKLEL